LEKSLKQIFIITFDILFLILLIAALIYGPGGYHDYIRATNDAERASACADFASILMDNELAAGLGVIDPELANDLQNPYYLRGENYRWHLKIHTIDLITGENTETKSSGLKIPTNVPVSVQTYAVAVRRGDQVLPGVLEVAVWR
jgi:hypothetical protein